jgi:arylformamidase
MLHEATILLRPGMPTYPGEDGPRLEMVKSMAKGDAADVRRLSLSLHTGTHVDAPTHFIKGGGGVEALSLDALVGPCVVAEIASQPHVTAAALESAFGAKAPERLILRTRNSTGPSPLWSRDAFDPEFAAIAPDAARWIADRGVKLVGIDYLSVEPFGAPEPLTHRTLLGAGVAIVEGLDLRKIPAGEYDLYCLPTFIQGADGAPARVILRRP